MRQRVAASALILTIASISAPPDAGAVSSGEAQSTWRRTDSRRFEIHYPLSLAGQLDRVTRSAERAYDRVGGRLNFTLGTKVPLVMFAPSGAFTREQVVAYAVSDDVAPQDPHRARIVLPLVEGEAQLDATMVHELTHLLVGEIILPHRPGTGGVPQWVLEGIATYMADGWSDEHERLMRELVASGNLPALSRLAGSGGFANARLNDALGHVAFEYIERRWGPGGIRRFVDALIVPNVGKTYDAVFELTPEEFDGAFRQFAQRRFGR